MLCYSGCLSIWDGEKGICTSSTKTHLSDILTVCLGNNQETVYCAGDLILFCDILIIIII